MLVPLYKLPSSQSHLDRLKEQGIVVRRANPWEITAVRKFIAETFSVGWADEASIGFARTPITTLVAVRGGAIVGFGSYECTRKAFFGPTGVHPDARKLGLGTALLLRCMEGLADLGYAYAIIGAAGPVDFYQKVCGAIAIPDSSPGMYTDLLTYRP
jgi:GNAT superfamily N-acetyltransferase